MVLGKSKPGSSPLARGLPKTTKAQEAKAGIIPARAGFTSDVSRAPGNIADHPRSRGVYDKSIILIILEEGSSPLARGLLRDQVRQVVCLGIIPARAGFTWVDTAHD